MVNKKSANRIAFSIQGNANRLRSKDKFGSCPVINTIHHFYFIFIISVISLSSALLLYSGASSHRFSTVISRLRAKSTV